MPLALEWKPGRGSADSYVRVRHATPQHAASGPCSAASASNSKKNSRIASWPPRPLAGTAPPVSYRSAASPRPVVDRRRIFAAERHDMRIGELRPGLGKDTADVARTVQNRPRSCKRIEPGQVRESREVAIGRAQGEPMFDGECCKMRIRDEIPIDAVQR